MRRIFACLLLTLCCLVDARSVRAQSDPASEVIQRVNALRAARGVPAYEVDSILMYVAQTQASWSAANNHIGHDGPGGSSPNDRALAAGYGGGLSSWVSENAAHGTASLNTPELVVTMWQGDNVHLSAMISPNYQHIGVGYAEAGGYSWYVMMVGRVTGQPADSNTQVQVTPQPPAPMGIFTMAEPDESGAIYHEVQEGQSAWTIAARYGIDLAQLYAMNNMTEDSVIQIGARLLIQPPYTPTVTPTVTRLPATSTPTPTVDPATPTPEGGSNEAEVAPGRKIFLLMFIGLGMALLATIIIVSRWQK